jgi:hypothetical protein
MLRLTRARVIAIAAWPGVPGPAGLLCLAFTLVTSDARADDGAAARTLVLELGADTAHAAILAEPLGRAREALERGTRLRESGDEVRAKAADGLSLEWAETAKDLARAADAENTAAARRREAIAKQAQVERERALVEADLAHVGRLRKELEGASGPGTARGADAARSAVEVHDGQTTKSAAKKAARKPATEPAESGDKP